MGRGTSGGIFTWGEQQDVTHLPRTWDGSITLVDAAAGGPLILYDAQDGKRGPHSADPRAPGDSPIVGVARLADPSDHYLQTWTRADDNPVNFTGPPIAFPGPVWQNGDHWNFVGQGARFESPDPSFHSWTNKGPFVGLGETSGQWWMPVPNQANGQPPPAGAPNRAVNVGNGGASMGPGEERARPTAQSTWATAVRPMGKRCLRGQPPAA